MLNFRNAVIKQLIQDHLLQKCNEGMLLLSSKWGPIGVMYGSSTDQVRVKYGYSIKT